MIHGIAISLKPTHIRPQRYSLLTLRVRFSTNLGPQTEYSDIFRNFPQYLNDLEHL